MNLFPSSIGINKEYFSTIAKENFIANGNNRIIITTDGDFNVGTSNDADLVRMIEEKRKVAGAIVGSDESWLAKLDNDAFKQLIALNKQALLD